MVPVLATFGPVTLYTHDVFSALALAVGLGLYYRELRRRGWLDGRILAISIAAVVGGVIGARTITAWEHLSYYAAFGAVPFTEFIERSGKSILGAIAGGYLATVLAKRALGYRRSTGDCYVLAIPVATVIGRVGCLLSELPLGTPTTLPWGVRVEPAAAATHPSMVYEILFNLVAIGAIVRLRGRVPVQGDLLKGYLLTAFVFRFLVEFTRANPVQAWGLTGPQTVLIPLVAWLAWHFVRQVRRGVYRLPAPPEPRPAPVIAR